LRKKKISFPPNSKKHKIPCQHVVNDIKLGVGMKEVNAAKVQIQKTITWTKKVEQR
jgi:hypothetical protein